MYPGLLDGIQPNCSYTDLWTTAPDVVDCGLLVHYFEANPAASRWVPAIDGHQDPSDCAAWDALFYDVGDPTRAGNCKLPDEQPSTTPTATRAACAARCRTTWRRSGAPARRASGRRSRRRSAAASPIGRGATTASSTGSRRCRTGTITPAEFVDLNAKIGGLDDRPQAAARALRGRRQHRARSPTARGQVTDARQLANVPIIDLRGLQRDRRDPHVVLQLQDARPAGPAQRRPRQPDHLDVPGGGADHRRRRRRRTSRSSRSC